MAVLLGIIYYELEPLSLLAPLSAYQHYRGWGKSSSIVLCLNDIFDQKKMSENYKVCY